MTLSNHCPARLADYFAVCGLDFTSGLESDSIHANVQCAPLERSYKGKVLEHYPKNVPWNTFDHNSVCMLSLPQGLQFKTQKHSLEPKFHSFLVTREDGSRYYGFSLVFYEEVRNKKVCNAMHTLQAMYVTELSSSVVVSNKQLNNSRSLPHHFKLSCHQSQNYYDVKDTLYVTKSIVIVMQLPFVTAACKFLASLHRYAMTKPKVPDQLSVESYIYHFLYEIPLPLPGRSVEFDLVNTQETVILQRPITIEELPLLDYSLRELFACLSVEVVIELFTCVLLENQVLICSTDFQKLMLVAECVTSLLFPFTWQHVYVPILPASLQHFLDAPVPFIMGLHSQESQLKTAIAGDLCYVNVDTGEIEVPEELPNFPKKLDFCSDLSMLLEKYGVSRTNCISHHTADVMTSSAIVSGGFGEQIRRKHSWCAEADTNENNPMTKMFDIGKMSGTENVVVNGPAKSNYSTECELKLNNAIRETFLHRFVSLFTSYEHFVIVPNEADKNEWFRERETMQNFDKATFLSDQPTQDLPFLSQFLETQMFASFIDSKILASYNEIDPNLRVFDKRIKNSRKRSNREDAGGRVESCSAQIRASQLLLEKRLSSVDAHVPPPKEILPNPSEHFKLSRAPRNFPALEAFALNKEPTRRYYTAGSQWSLRRGSSPHNSLPRDMTRINNFPSKMNKTSTNFDQSPARIAQANWDFVEKLLKECKMKTNRMVVEKMGAEGVLLGKEQVGNIEENTSIASLCDLLERVWSHAIQEKKDKSALWSHLLKFQQLEECNDNTKASDSGYFTPAITWCALRKRLDYLSSLALELDLTSRSGDSSPATTPDSRSLDRRSMDRRQENVTLKSLPVSVVFDIRNVQAMTEIKSHLGYARAWVRLALEKKLLSRHLRTLLSVTNLVKSQYKRNAFLRCEEEKEQFLYHLLSLNAVDYFCFTNTYLSAKLPYRVVVIPSRKASVSSTTANAWIAISGTNCETSQVPIPKGTLDFLFHHKNLGMLTSLRIGHDNLGLSPNWMVESVLVRCEVTGHTYRFPCGRYLGKSIDDGSTERLLAGELLRRAEPDSADSVGNTSTPPVQCRSPMMSRRDTRLSVAEVQHMIGDSVNNIVKYFHRFTTTRQRENCASLTPLLCGEMGLVHSLEQAFLYGFKASRLFGRNLYLWDYFTRVKEQFDVLLSESSAKQKERSSVNNNADGNETERRRERQSDHIPRSMAATAITCKRSSGSQFVESSRDGKRSASGGRVQPTSNTQVMEKYCEIVQRIDNANRTFGKDGKFQRFVCFAVRDHILHRMLTPMAAARPTLEMYEDNSFLRNSSHRSFLYEILQSLDEYEFFLESSITSGVDVT